MKRGKKYMDSKLFVGVISVFIAIVVLAGALMPVINDAATGEVTIHITNDDSSTLTLQKATSNFALDLSVSTDGDSNIVIANGSDSMTIDPNESFFIVATDSAAIYYDQGIVNLVWTDNGTTTQREIDNPFTAVIADNKLTVDDGTVTDLPLPTTYMFSPSSTGGYGSFTAPDLNLVPNDPVIAAGTFAGVYCYNANTTIGDSLQEYVTVSDNVLEEVIWAIPAPADDQQIIITPLDPSIFDPLNPIDTDPIIIDPFDPGDNIIMSVPTPTYTDGDWGYDISGTNATIVSYSGAGGDNLVIPSTIGGYTVTKVGKGGSGETIFDTSLSVNNLIISEGITNIDSYAFYNCSGLTGTLTLPDSLTNIGQRVFNGTALSGTIVIPSGVTYVNTSAFSNITDLNTVIIEGSSVELRLKIFENDSNLKNLVVLGSLTFASTTFTYSGLKQILNLGSSTLTAGSDGLSPDVEIRQGDNAYIDAQLFLAPADVAITEGSPSPYEPLLKAIPLLVIIAILMMIVGYTMIRRSN